VNKEEEEEEDFATLKKISLFIKHEMLPIN
jgi:hypothetical protein